MEDKQQSAPVSPQSAQPQAQPEEQQSQEEKKKCDVKYWLIRLSDGFQKAYGNHPVTIVLLLVVIIVLIVIYNDWVSDKITEFLEWLGENPALGTFTQEESKILKFMAVLEPQTVLLQICRLLRQACLHMSEARVFFGGFCLALIYIVATLIFLPGSLLTLGAGVALNSALDSTALAIFVGSVGVWVGAWIGSNMAMLLGRYLFRDGAKKLANKYRVINAIDKVLEKEGLKFTLLLRLCPLVPFNAFNYIMGVTSVSFKDYAIGGVGMIPGTIVYVFVGTTIGNITDAAQGNFEGGTATLILLIVGTILAFAAIVYITIVVRRYLRKQLAEDDAKKESAAVADQEAALAAKKNQETPRGEDEKAE